MGYILITALIVVMFLNFIESIWITKVRNQEQRIHATQIYRVYEKIKRYNDNQFGTKGENVGKTEI